MAQGKSTVESDYNKQPQLKKYFIAITVILVIAILLGQLYQDFHRKQEHLDAKRIHSHQIQNSLVAELMSNLLLLTDVDTMNTVLKDATVNKLIHNQKQVIVVQDNIAIDSEQRSMAHDDVLLAEQELKLSLYIDDILLMSNEVIAAIEQQSLDSQLAMTQHQHYLPKVQQYQRESERFIENLNDYLEKESYEHRMILWVLVMGIMALVCIVGFIFYRFVSGMVNRDFQLIAEDNLLRQQKEQESIEHAQLMSNQQMKMRSILDSTVDAIITITFDGKVDSFNKAAESMFGYPANFVIGKNVKILMPEPYASEHDAYLQRYQNTNEKKIIGIGREVIGKRIDGSEFPIHLSVSEVSQSEPKIFTGIVRDITERKKADKKLKQTMDELRNKQAQLEEEEKIAQHVFENITATNNDTLPELESWSVPMGAFSGDMMLSTLLPSGALRMVLCDFTGHGLPAALGAVPVSSIHHAMAQKGLPLEILMDELNNKLKALLPTGIFCCIVGIDIDANRTHAHVWNAGLPEVLLVDQSGEIKQRFSSDHLPLGVVTYERDELHCQDVRLEPHDCLYAYSDGLTEAENIAGKMFGQEQFEQLIAKASSEDGRIVEIRNTVINYMGTAAATDDISLVEIKTLS